VEGGPKGERVEGGPEGERVEEGPEGGMVHLLRETERKAAASEIGRGRETG